MGQAVAFFRDPFCKGPKPKSGTVLRVSRMSGEETRGTAVADGHFVESCSCPTALKLSPNGTDAHSDGRRDCVPAGANASPSIGEQGRVSVRMLQVWKLGSNAATASFDRSGRVLSRRSLKANTFWRSRPKPLRVQCASRFKGMVLRRWGAHGSSSVSRPVPPGGSEYPVPICRSTGLMLRLSGAEFRSRAPKPCAT